VPGPACYGQGGTEATTTDATVVLGIIAPDEFLGGEMQLDRDKAAEAVLYNVARPLGLGLEEAALGIVAVANANMIQAIRTLSVERGHDVRGFSLLAFGGAGPVYAAYMARELGMAEVIAPRNPGVFAALGLLLSDIRHSQQTAWQMPLGRVTQDELGRRLAALEAELEHELAQDGVASADRYFRFAADMRCVGQFHQLQIPLPAPDGAAWFDAAALAAAFHAAHERAYGHADPATPIELVNLRVEGLGRVPKPPLAEEAAAGAMPPAPLYRRKVYLDRESGWVETPIYARAHLAEGHVVDGPAILLQRDSTILVLADQHARVDALGVVRIRAKAD
jgi:N-methylhydantoinase A